MADQPIKPTLDQLYRELGGYMAGIAVMLDEFYEFGAGRRVLGLAADTPLEGALGRVDLKQIKLARHLPVYYEYAYEARLPSGHEHSVDPSSGLLEYLRDFLETLNTSSGYFELVLDVVGLDRQETGFLQAMLARLKARYALDHGDTLTVEELAVLAEMNEKSVRNAANAEGEAKLRINEQGYVENREAKRWLKDRRGFKPTQTATFPEELNSIPDVLSASEIPTFISHRLKVLSAGDADFLGRLVIDSPDFEFAVPEFVENIAKEIGMEPAALRASMTLPLNIRPQDCEAIARAIKVDPVWFTLQVMSALFPTQVDMLLNPSNHRAMAPEDLSSQAREIEVVLTENMIQHGYLDIPATTKSFFPEDCFGSRQSDDKGREIELRFGGQAATTDMRVKSEKTISPRKRFSAWFQSQLHAVPGERIRIQRIEERVYQLERLA